MKVEKGISLPAGNDIPSSAITLNFTVLRAAGVCLSVTDEGLHMWCDPDRPFNEAAYRSLNKYSDLMGYSVSDNVLLLAALAQIEVKITVANVLQVRGQE